MRNPPPSTRTVYCEDALPWLAKNAPLLGCSVITSLPDVSGFQGLTLEAWREWFIGAADQTLRATATDGVTIFYQTDIKVDGTWVDKSFLCHLAAERAGAHLLWHKIVLRRELGQPAFGRPGYSHLLCYSRGVRDRIAHSYADVLPQAGQMTWTQAMGHDACDFACRYIESHTETRTVVDPFCGVGTALAVANARGMNAIGVELSKRRAKKARKLEVLAGGELGIRHPATGDSEAAPSSLKTQSQ
jgi:hypothetical protein